jgi:hypothetical protein
MRHLRQYRWWYIVAALYLLTWLGGWIAHAHELRVFSDDYWSYLDGKLQVAMVEQRKQRDEFPRTYQVYESGPRSWVRWCLPILPGILLVDSGYSVGPLHARAGIKLVVYYGVGSSELCMLAGWVS